MDTELLGAAVSFDDCDRSFFIDSKLVFALALPSPLCLAQHTEANSDEIAKLTCCKSLHELMYLRIVNVRFKFIKIIIYSPIVEKSRTGSRALIKASPNAPRVQLFVMIG